MNDFEQCGWILDGRRLKIVAIIKIESEWMSEVSFWDKMAESKMAVFKMTAIIKLSENEWVWVRLNKVSESKILCKMSESHMAEFKMATFIKLSQNEWVWVSLN